MASVLPRAGTLPASWLVRLPAFEGPLDLLLDLIRLHKVEIVDIPVAVVCDQFHEYLDLMDRLDLDIAGDFLYMAAYLVHLKSKMLLPTPKTLDGEEVDEDPRADLVARLLEYRKLKEAAQSFAEVDAVRRGLWVRSSDEMRRIAKDEAPEIDISDLSLFDLLKTFHRVLDRYESEHPEPLLMSGERYSVRDQVQRLLARLPPDRSLDLFDDLAALSGRREAIAAFLAVLEMIKLELLRIHVGAGGTRLYRTGREVSHAELEALQA
ncbi:MAG: segregation/condensation protein A [Acidobacteriota bacterium]